MTNSKMVNGFAYCMFDNVNGLAVGPNNGNYKLFRVWRQENGDYFHQCLSIFLDEASAMIMVNFLNEQFQLGVNYSVH